VKVHYETRDVAGYLLTVAKGRTQDEGGGGRTLIKAQVFGPTMVRCTAASTAVFC